MGKQKLVIPLLLILVIFVMSSPGIIFADEHDPKPTCESGTELVNGICQDIPVDYWSPNSMLIYGILIAAFATIVGIAVTIVDRKSAKQTRLQEIMKTYSDEIREITNQESNLDTKQACSLYVEQYLDTLEQIATLKTQKIFKDKAIDYFNNNFAYGRDLWWWYHKFVHGFNDDTQDKIWAATEKTKSIRFSLSDLYPEPKEFEKHKGNDKYLENFLDDDRWPEFRKLCATKPITPFDNEYSGIGGKSGDEWRVLPDIMYYDYEKIPDENGLTKAELVEIIRPYANDLSEYVDDEQDMTTPVEFEVYAEQYLETLEQIATLYRCEILPMKAKEYFENKFSYGCNLWEWYHKRTLKFSKNLLEAFWKTSSALIKLEDMFTKEQIAVMKPEEKIEVEKKALAEVKDKTYWEFIEYYSIKNEENALYNFKIEDPDIWKLVKLAANAAIKQYDADVVLKNKYKTLKTELSQKNPKQIEVLFTALLKKTAMTSLDTLTKEQQITKLINDELGVRFEPDDPKPINFDRNIIKNIESFVKTNEKRLKDEIEKVTDKKAVLDTLTAEVTTPENEIEEATKNLEKAEEAGTQQKYLLIWTQNTLIHC